MKRVILIAVLCLLSGITLGDYDGFVSGNYLFEQLNSCENGDDFACDWSKSYLYWVITVVMMLLGGCMVMVYMKSSAVLNAFLAVHIGASTPLIISGITRETPSISIGNID